MSRPRTRRPLRLAGRALALTAGVIVLGGSSAGARTPLGQRLVPDILGGAQSSISQFPWQVYVLLYDEAEGLQGSCGGSILDASHVLTAAHCVERQGAVSSYPASEVFVIAGASEVDGYGGPFADFTLHPHTAQAVGVRSFRTDPYHTVKPQVKDDVAVLTLQEPLTLSAQASTEAIGLVRSGATPAPGTTLSVSGYGKQEGAQAAQPNGRLYATTLTAIGSDACRTDVGVNSAVLLCAQSASSATCQGDSGGPVTEGSPPVQVGIVDFGAKECPPGEPDVFANLAAPEIRDFVAGSQSPPVAPRPSSPPVIRALGAHPGQLSPLSCRPGAWSGSPSFTYTFQVEAGSARVLQSGRSSTFAPASSLAGARLVCIVRASNAGGVSTLRSATTAPLAPATTAPVARRGSPARAVAEGGHPQQAPVAFRA